LASTLKNGNRKAKVSRLSSVGQVSVCRSEKQIVAGLQPMVLKIKLPSQTTTMANTNFPRQRGNGECPTARGKVERVGFARKTFFKTKWKWGK